MAKGKASGGGVKSARDVHAYRPPQGPSNILDPHSPGLHGSRMRHGTQGPIAAKSRESGRVGLGGENRGRGVNRRG
jgi:hypothetical protein